MNSTCALTTGSRVMYEGEMWQVTEMTGRRVLLERAGASSVNVLITRLLSAPGFRMADDVGSNVMALGPSLSALKREEYREALKREAHLREVQTGFRSGDPDRPLPGEPQPEYLPSVNMGDRWDAKARELGRKARTIKYWYQQYEAFGLIALVDKRSYRKTDRLGRTDRRWCYIACDVIAQHVNKSQPSVQYIIELTHERARREYGDDIKLPSRETARKIVLEMHKGQQAFSGLSAKQKRSIANRPNVPYGSWRSTRVGEYLVLDSTILDVIGRDPITLKPISLQLTTAMDLCSHSICGLRLSVTAANSMDVALVLFESLLPNSRSHTNIGIVAYGSLAAAEPLPYCGVPGTVFLPKGYRGNGLPGTVPETMIIDHGKPYMSRHMRDVGESFGISIQPAHVYTPTDKAIIERFFLTLRTRLLCRLPGYKGPDVHSRGKNPEKEALYFPFELEGIIREWISSDYHTKPQRGLYSLQFPQRKLSPNQMWEIAVAQSGSLTIPRRPEIAYDFLPIEWRTIQHYGVELNTLRYDGEGLNGYRDVTSPYLGRKGVVGKWPIRYDPDDATRVYFQREDNWEWATLLCEHAEDIHAPFSHNIVKLAREWAESEGWPKEDHTSAKKIIEYANAGLGEGIRERKASLRSAERNGWATIDPPVGRGRIGALPAAPWIDPDATDERLDMIAALEAPTGDDDAEDELVNDAEYYANATPVAE